MKKTIETIVMSAAFTTLLGCDTSSSSSSTPCTNESDEYTVCNRNETNCETYSKSAECAKKGGTYNCSEATNEMNNNTYCACSCSYQNDQNSKPDKGW